MSDNKFILNYDLVTKLDLEAAVITHELRKAEQALTKWVMNTREQATREALIKLGWTPPGAKIEPTVGLLKAALSLERAS